MARNRRLPARVYWTRRLAVLGTAALLVFATGRLLTGSSDAKDPAESAGAVQVAAGPSPSASSTGPKIRMPKGTKKPRKSRLPKPSPTPLAQPSGPCTPADVAVVPEVQDPVGGSEITVRLALHTLVSAACTWEVSPKTLTVAITSGHDAIWSTRQCPRAIPESNVVVRRDVATFVNVVWSAKRSDETCSPRTDWAMPGWYHVTVAALGGEPADEQFELVAPPKPTITVTATPNPPKH